MPAARRSQSQAGSEQEQKAAVEEALREAALHTKWSTVRKEELDRLRAIEAAAQAYRDAVVTKREREAEVEGKLVLSAEGVAYRAAHADKKTKGEALFALLRPTGVSVEFAEAIEAQREIDRLLALEAEQAHADGCALQKPHYGECYVPGVIERRDR
jgi:hypothetical protein